MHQQMIPHHMIMDPNMYYKMQHHVHDMQEDSYSSDDGNENESESIA